MLLYIIIGFVQLFTIELIRFRMSKLGKEISITHGNRLAVILLWPIWAFFFWYNFFRELMRRNV